MYFQIRSTEEVSIHEEPVKEADKREVTLWM